MLDIRIEYVIKEAHISIRKKDYLINGVSITKQFGETKIYTLKNITY